MITLVLHFRANEWDGPLSLHEMMAAENEDILKFVQNCQVYLIDPAKFTEDDLQKFSTSLREVMGYIKYSKDKDKLSAFINNNPRMHMEVNAARVIKTITNTKIEIPEDAEVIDVGHGIECASSVVGRTFENMP